MRTSRKSKVERRAINVLGHCVRHSPFGIRPYSAFTLIEIMVAVGIIAIILTIAIPHFAQQMHKDSMRQAVSDVLDACGHARARAILDGTVVELSIRVPPNGSIEVRSSGRASADGPEAEPVQPSGGGGVFSAKFSDHITKVDAMVFEAAERDLKGEVICKFYKDGTCDYMRVELTSDHNEVRVITTDVVTGIADVEVVR